MTLIQTIRIVSQDIGMEFSIGKRATLKMKSRKKETAEGRELWNQKSIRMFGKKENYKYLKADTIKQAEMKLKIRKECLRRMWKLLETKLCCRNFIKGINILIVLLIRYSKPLLKWTRERLRQMDQRIRNDIDNLYASRKEGRLGLGCIKNSLTQGLI